MTVSENEVRKLLVRALDDASVFGIRDEALQQSFVDGRRDVAFAELDIDSLARMELCIAIEVETGVVIVPGDLEHMASLGELARAICTR